MSTPVDSDSAGAAGWEPRLVEVLGSPLDRVSRTHLQALVERGLREDVDLEFKRALYGGSDKSKRDLAADVAALANERGGVIVLGLAEKDGVASALCSVDVSEAEELRMRQVIAAQCAPHIQFDVVRISDPLTTGRGFYLIVVPPSASRPHSVRKDVDLRYPRRDGAHTRYMTEAEVADLYRNRFSESSQGPGLEHLEGIREDLATLPRTTASLIGQIFQDVAREAAPSGSNAKRGWEMEYEATVGYADVLGGGPPYQLLVEFPVGAHSAALLAFEEDVMAGHVKLLGQITNGVGASFHVREAPGGGAEIVTLNYVEPLLDDRAFADMPTQTVYYRYDGTEFVEVGRGEVYDPREPYNIPRSVRPFLSPEWVAEYG